ncbi:MAG TPA: hypothetical protein VLY63_22320 [Anaerolineae bacterium]|nr:hypothetical protein [Anaerolineae bacterium]
MHKTDRFLVMALLIVLAASLSGLALADEPNRAGLVIQYGDGRIDARCVAFEEDEISGADLLTRSRLDAIMDASGGMGLTLCQVEGEGCAYPAEPCFCQCMGGGECAYWNYFYQDPGETEWTYSALGAALRKVRPGSVEAWVWGDGSAPPQSEGTFEVICAPSTAEPASTAGPADAPDPSTLSLATAPAIATETPRPTDLPTGLPTTTTSVPTESPTLFPTDAVPAPSPPPVTNAGQALARYWAFGLAVIGLALIGLLVWLRRT